MAWRSAIPALLLFLAACGGNGEPSKSEYIAQADEICAELDEKVDEMEAPETPEELRASIDELETITDEGIRDLRALSPPAEDQEVVARMLDRIEHAVLLLPDLAAAGKRNDTDELERLGTEIQTAANDASAIARDYGFERCGGDSVQPNGG